MSERVLSLLKHERAFQAFKYTIYCLLFVDVLLFLQEDWLSSSFVFTQGVALGDVYSAFVASIDTAAWVVLLLIFELETWVMDDDKIKGAVKWFLNGVRGLCYVFIVLSFFGYVVNSKELYAYSLVDIGSACEMLPLYPSFMTDMDEYVAITAANCSELGRGESFFANAGSHILSSASGLNSAIALAWTDVINSATWLVVVVVLEFDVYLQLAGSYRDQYVKANTAIKTILYSILFVVAGYWGYAGSFLDFWDAFLWLVAFVFIELNIFEWQAETSAASSESLEGTVLDETSGAHL